MLKKEQILTKIVRRGKHIEYFKKVDNTYKLSQSVQFFFSPPSAICLTDKIRRLKKTNNIAHSFSETNTMIPARLVRQTASGTKYVTIPSPSSLSAATSNTPTICFIPGYRSEFMASHKSHLAYDIARRLRYRFMAWDHHPVDGSVQQWYEASCELLAAEIQDGASGDRNNNVVYLISSSMGTWLSLLLARRFSHNVRGILGIGSGVDFTERWLQNEVPVDHRCDRTYVWKRPSQYDPSGYYAVPVASLLDSRPMLIMDNDRRNLPTLSNCPITLIHGGQDVDVPLSLAQDLARELQLHGNEVVLDIIEDGDHRLSRPHDLQRIGKRAIGMVAKGETLHKMKP
ncbi:Alpha/Beta hydrolase protein [Zychaea mexicana]|uniref:Alpha/Beta hydrolase protein n=1 Tax=Zychaea mexicana TaxID=64656 RepID=UPI0022FE3B74|nr:Alpha/Beta hydrolase protein [Zychaea mexicana]KAI9477127.1 Alpha/Beta hydrolase protein [Zychaea mexicana]